MIELTVNDMTCGGCVASITRVVKGLDANATVNADVASKRVKIASAVNADKVIAAISDAGYHPVVA
ncbi:MAG: heavy-metal-associated domain-containing protein [Burkholderiales bacterium]|nr:heavy-metal-associated domain-containing protein [Burkholderiales bacterium]